MIEMSKRERYPVMPKILKSLAKNINYYPGVKTFFKRISNYVETQFSDINVELRHYIISAGLKEIILGTSIAGYFYKIFASEYYYNEYDEAIFPKVIVNDTLKTQFIFRINKGRESLHENINLHMPAKLRPVPFQNILYIGDGLTDVPSNTLWKNSLISSLSDLVNYGMYYSINGNTVSIYKLGCYDGLGTNEISINVGLNLSINCS